MPATHHTPATTLTTCPTNVKAQPGAGTPGTTAHSGHAAVATPTTQTDNDYFASLSLAHQMMWRILGVFIFIGHLIYGVVCSIVNLATPALATHARSHNEEHPGLHPMMLVPRRTKAKAWKCPPNVRQDASTVTPPSQTPSSTAHASADEEKNEATASAERKPLNRLPSVLKKLGAPVRMISTINTRRISMRGSSTTQGRKNGSGDGTSDSDAPSFPRRLSFNSVQRIIPTVGRRRAMSDAMVPAKPTSSVSTNDRPRAASLPNTLPSTETRPTLRRVVSTHVPIRGDDRNGPSLYVLPPRNIRMPSRTRSDSLVTQSSSSRGDSSDMMHTSIEEVAEDNSDTEDSDTADDSDTGGPVTVVSTEDRGHQSGALGNLRRRLERRMTQRARRIVA